ncbi:MAG: HD domain-containing protein [Candidatus Cardinium sp.]|nr:HD domain-containing protein [Candidatus Cardinium sp.]
MFTITIALFVTLYATIGGARSVAFTDFMQILFFGLFMPMLFVITYQKLHPPTNIIDLLLNRIHSDWVDIVINNRPKISSMVLDIVTYVIPWMVSANIQRIYMSASVWQAKTVFTRAALVFTVVKILLATVGICLLHMHPDLKPSQFLHMITNDAPAGFNILLYIALISLIMSTVDSNLHMCTVTLVHDIIEPLTGSLKHKLIWARVATICVGGVGLWIAVSYPNLLYTTFYHMLTFCSSMVSIPFIIAIIGFFPRTLSVLLGMGAGILVTTIMQYYFHAKWNFIFPSMLANIAVLVVSHYLLPKLPHIGGMQDQEPLLIEKQLRKRKWKAYKEAMRTFCWKEYMRNIFPKTSTHFFRVGLYSEIYLCISLCYNQKLSWVYYFSPCMILATYFICYPIWHSNQTTHHKAVMHYVWLIGIFCLLFLPGALCFSISGYAIVPTMIYLLNIAVGFYFLPMPTACFMLLAAFVMTYFIAPYQPLALLVSTWGSWSNCLCLVFCWCVLIKYISLHKTIKTLLANQLAYWHELAFYKDQATIKKIQYQHHLDILTNHQEDVLQKVCSDLQQLLSNPDDVCHHKEIVKRSINSLDSYRTFLQDLAYYERDHITLEVDLVDIEHMFDRAITTFKKAGILFQVAIYHTTQQKYLECDAGKIEYLLFTSMRLIEESKNKLLEDQEIIRIHITDTKIKYNIDIETKFFKELPAVAFVITTSADKPRIDPLYTDLLEKAPGIVPSTITDLYEKEIMQIVSAHYGYGTITKQDATITFLYVLPLHLSKIRDNVMNTLPFYPNFKMMETAASLQQEIETEDLLVQATSLSRALVRDTILFIKKCHGDQKRASGDPFYTHPMAVARIVLMETQDSDVVIAALLHDVVEDSKVPLSYIESRFGRNVAYIVNQVTHMGNTFRKKKLTEEEYESMLQSCVDLRVLQVKLADRLHNIQTLSFRPLEKQISVAKHTLAFYLPLGRSVGITQLTVKIQKMCTAILDGLHHSK